MAKFNYVSLYGQVIDNPRTMVDREGILQKGSFVLKIVRRFVEDRGNIEFSTVAVLTANPAMVKTCTELKKGDMCVVKGVLTTVNITKTVHCTCGNTIEKNGTVTFVTPIFMEVQERISERFAKSLISNEEINAEGIKLLKQHNEISNIVHIIGTLCRDVEYYTDNKNSHSSYYQLAVDRHFRIKEGTPDLKTDYPWVRTYGEQAISDSNVLSTNSTVFIDGSITSKIVKRKVNCPICDSEISIEETAYEVRPYSVEYLHNCNIPEV